MSESTKYYVDCVITVPSKTGDEAACERVENMPLPHGITLEVLSVYPTEDEALNHEEHPSN